MGNPVFAQASAGVPARWAPDADRQERVEKLVGQMTLEEKVSQMRNHAPAIPRLGIPAYDYWSEGLHGIARSGYATLFPQAIGMAASWDTALLHQVSTTISIEARAKYNQAVRENNHDIYFGLTIWSPNINIFRDPRWGRGQETYGEDPFLTSRLGVAFVTGLQGDDARYLRVISTPKHFAVHSGPESERHRFNVDVSPHDLADTYLPAFRATVTEAQAQSVMCAYNAVDTEPACANTHLLSEVLRRDWKFGGFVTSDCGAIGDISDGHKFSADWEHAAVAAVRAGTDTSCGAEYDALTKAVHDGLIRETELDVAVRRLFRARFSLGMFDAPEQVSYSKLAYPEVDQPSHRELALKAARESMVLLKNDGTLPLNKSVKTIGVIGPNAASLAALEGNYNAVPSHPVTPLDGIRTVLAGKAKVLYAAGALYVDGIGAPAPESIFSPGNGSKEHGLHAEYFSNAALEGKAAMERTDRQIDFDWNSAKPGAAIPAGSFGVRWTGAIEVPVAGAYTFNLTFADCYPCNDLETYAVYVDGKEVARGKTEGKASRSSQNAPFSVTFSDTKPHAFRLEYTHASPLFGAGITLNWQPPQGALLEQAVKVAEASDVVVAFVGLSRDLEGEEMPIKVDGFAGGDRSKIDLPAAQEQMLEAVARTGKPLVVVLMNGSALAVNWAQEHAAAILEAWYPGEAGGTAIGETLLGINNPAGRLPVTFYASLDQLPQFEDYSMKERTYRYSHAKPLYAFGSGLSYSRFVYSDVRLGSEKVAAGDPVTVSARITNAGGVDGDEVVEVYLTAPQTDLSPIRALVGFERIHLRTGASQSVTVTIDPRQIAQVDGAGKRLIAPGRYVLHVGGKQPESDEAGVAFEVVGSKELPN